MMRGVSTGQALSLIATILFLPMLLLIPVELAILKHVGGLGDKTWTAYGCCLVAKIVAVAFVTGAATIGMVKGVIAAEALYSLAHFVFAYLIIKDWSRNAIQTAALISTVIPWLYSAGIPFTYYVLVKSGFERSGT
jgi:hypothetical protein